MTDNRKFHVRICALVYIWGHYFDDFTWLEWQKPRCHNECHKHQIIVTTRNCVPFMESISNTNTRTHLYVCVLNNSFGILSLARRLYFYYLFVFFLPLCYLLMRSTCHIRARIAALKVFLAADSLAAPQQF